jgi:hypothetical protein
VPLIDFRGPGVNGISGGPVTKKNKIPVFFIYKGKIENMLEWYV